MANEKLAFWTACISFFIAFWPAEILALLLHETGHAIAARALGHSVISWGVGFRKIFLRMPLGRAVFYFGWPMNQGLTLYARQSLDFSRTAEFVIVAGGIVANVVGIAAGLVLWSNGWASGIVLAWIVASTLLCVRNAFPHKVRVAGTSIATDGRKLIVLAFRRDYVGVAHLGTELKHLRAIVQLLERVGHQPGIAFFRLRAALLEAILGNLGQARDEIARAEAAAPIEIPTATELLAIARLVIACESNEDQTPELAERTHLAFGSNQNVQFTIDCSLALWRHARGMPIGDLVDAIRRQGEAARQPRRTATADVLGFIAEPTETPDVRCRQIIEQHRTRLGVARIDLLTAAASSLATLGRTESAREFRAEAVAEIRQEASYIDSSETRTAFISRAVDRLQAVLPEEPLPTHSLEPPSIPPPLPAEPFCGTALIFGTATLLGTAACAISSHFWGISDDVAIHCVLLSLAGCLMALASFWASVDNREQRRRRAYLGALFALIGLSISMIVLLPSWWHH